MKCLSEIFAIFNALFLYGYVDYIITDFKIVVIKTILCKMNLSLFITVKFIEIKKKNLCEIYIHAL